MQTPHTSHIIYGLFKYEQTHNRRPGRRNPLGGMKKTRKRWWWWQRGWVANLNMSQIRGVRSRGKNDQSQKTSQDNSNRRWWRRSRKRGDTISRRCCCCWSIAQSFGTPKSGGKKCSVIEYVHNTSSSGAICCISLLAAFCSTKLKTNRFEELQRQRKNKLCSYCCCDC